MRMKMSDEIGICINKRHIRSKDTEAANHFLMETCMIPAMTKQRKRNDNINTVHQKRLNACEIVMFEEKL